MAKFDNDNIGRRHLIKRSMVPMVVKKTRPNVANESARKAFEQSPKNSFIFFSSYFSV